MLPVVIFQNAHEHRCRESSASLSLFADLSRKKQSVAQFPVRNMLRSQVGGLHEWRSTTRQRKMASIWAWEVEYESCNTKGCCALFCSAWLFLLDRSASANSCQHSTVINTWHRQDTLPKCKLWHQSHPQSSLPPRVLFGELFELLSGCFFNVHTRECNSFSFLSKQEQCLYALAFCSLVSKW